MRVGAADSAGAKRLARTLSQSARSVRKCPRVRERAKEGLTGYVARGQRQGEKAEASRQAVSPLTTSTPQSPATRLHG
jgi:hypothetical protein